MSTFPPLCQNVASAIDNALQDAAENEPNPAARLTLQELRGAVDGIASKLNELTCAEIELKDLRSELRGMQRVTRFSGLYDEAPAESVAEAAGACMEWLKAAIVQKESEVKALRKSVRRAQKTPQNSRQRDAGPLP